MAVSRSVALSVTWSAVPGPVFPVSGAGRCSAAGDSAGGVASSPCGSSGSRWWPLVAGALDVGWSAAPRWRTDPAVVDGALQLAGLWSSARRGGTWLPTGIAEIEVYVPGLLRGPLRAALDGRELDHDRSVSDVWVLAQDGTTVAELRGVTFHRYG